jgi:hypothetical protein
MRLIALVIVFLIQTLTYSLDPPTQVYVFESSCCPRCIFFATHDIKEMVGLQNYQQAVNMTIIPSLNLKQTKNPDGSYNYDSTCGRIYTIKAKYMTCASHLYSNDRALNFIANIIDSKLSMTDAVKSFFSEDQGAKIFNCYNTRMVGDFIFSDLQLYYANNDKNSPSLMPLIKVDGKQWYVLNYTSTFMKFICSTYRKDANELDACRNVKSSLKLLESENHTSDFYDAFWNSNDE